MRYIKGAFGYLKKTWAMIIGHIFYDSKYLKGRYFSKYSYSDGWRWVLETVFMQKIIGINRNIPFPVSFRATVLNWQNIVFDPDNINIFQKAGNYYQATQDSKIVIGKNCYIACNVGIITANHNLSDLSQHYPGKDVVIGPNSWIGLGAVILPGVVLGEHTIVGANAVVTKSFTEGNCVIAGNPAKLIRRIPEYEGNNDMKILENQKECVGCGLCANVCPQKCIHMEYERDGFWYPHIDKNKCISCGMCRKFCPVLKDAVHVEPCACYALAEAEETSRKKSASGAASAVFHKHIIQQGGTFCGVKLDDKLRAVHDVNSDIENIDLYRDSKYVQSDMDRVWEKIEECLQHGKKVLVTGTPCQIAAVHSRFGDLDKLILVDIICSGVPNPSIFELYKKSLEQKKGQLLKEFYFRDKTNGWKKSNIRVVYADGSEEIITRNDSEYFQLFGNDLYFRECCYECHFKNFNTYSDITIGDYWGIEEMYPDMADDAGCSVVIVNTQKGKQFFELSTEKCVVKRTPLEFAIKTHPKLKKSITKSPYRDLFFKMYSIGNEKTYKKAVKRCIGNSLFDKVMRKISKR